MWKRILAALAVTAAVAAVAPASPAQAAAPPAQPGAGPAVQGQTGAIKAGVGETAIDPAFPSDWPRWRFLVQDPANRARWAMDAAYSGGHGSSVWLWEQNWGDAQLWYQEGPYLHPAYNRWLCLGVNGAYRGSPLLIQNCDGSMNQRFDIVWGGPGGGQREIRSQIDGRCIDVQYSQFRAGTILWLWDCWNFAGASQRWLRPAPERVDTRDRVVLFVHGYHPTGAYDCNGYWGDMKGKMQSWGWNAAKFRTVGYYAGSSGCDVQIANGDTGYAVQYLGERLAWYIYNNFSSKHVVVDIVGHSMGGLVARAAVNGTRNGYQEIDGRWPPYLFVEDAVTFGTPHNGTGTAALCYAPHRQCQDMWPGSEFMVWLSQSENPQSTQGTDWTVIASNDDVVVPDADSALGVEGAGHKILYYQGQNMCHDCFHHTTSGSFTMWNWNYHDNGPGHNYTGGSPVSSASNALFNWWRW